MDSTKIASRIEKLTKTLRATSNKLLYLVEHLPPEIEEDLDDRLSELTSLVDYGEVDFLRKELMATKSFSGFKGQHPANVEFVRAVAAYAEIYFDALPVEGDSPLLGHQHTDATREVGELAAKIAERAINSRLL